MTALLVAVAVGIGVGAASARYWDTPLDVPGRVLGIVPYAASLNEPRHLTEPYTRSTGRREPAALLLPGAVLTEATLYALFVGPLQRSSRRSHRSIAYECLPPRRSDDPTPVG